MESPLSHSPLPAMRLTAKLPILIVLTALCIAILAGAVASWSLYAASSRMIETNLTVIARSKRDQVAALIGSVRNDLLSAASNPAVAQSLDDLAVGFKILSPADRGRLQGRYASGASAEPAIRSLSDFYGNAHGMINEWFRSFAHEHGYADVIFVDRDGNVAYSLSKRDDYGKNVHVGALQNSVLTEVFDQAANGASGTTLVSDFEFYTPAQRPISFSATPVYHKLGSTADFVGVLVFELPSVRIDAILNDPEGFGEYGEAIMVGEDAHFRSNSRFGFRTDILRSGFDVGPAHDQPESTRNRTYRGRDVIVATAALVSGSLRWSVIAVERADEVFRPVYLMIVRIVGSCLAATAILGLASAAIARRMARPIEDLVERFDAALSNMPHGLEMVDAQKHLILCNASYRAMYGLPPHLTAAGTSIDRIMADRVERRTAPALAVPGAARRSTMALDLTGRTELQDGRTVEVTRNPIPSGGYVATHQEITGAVRAQAQIRHLATHDALTGLPNRTQLRDRMAEALEGVAQGEQIAVLCLDLDHFKAVNDTLGHSVGDLLLKAVTSRLKACLPDTNTVARLGGDEFIILQTGVEGRAQVDGLAKRLIAAIAAPFDLNGHQVVIGISVGVALAPQDGNDADTLIKNADTALYCAKGEGRGQSRYFEPQMDAELRERRQLELDLREALAGNQFSVHYQPLYDATTSAVTGVEALLRWRHPKRGAVSPAVFIPVAEDTGLIVAIGEWVIRRACADAVHWPAHIRVAVNLSPVQFKTATLVHTIVSALGSSGLSPFRLEVEITESVLLADSEATLATLHHLRTLGIRIALDDFGTGYSSLSYLRSFPFDKIKIDQSFVRGFDGNPGSIAIIKAICDLGAGLGMSTTAEGVETEQQLAMVRRQGCTEVQGFYFCAPCPAAEIAHLMAPESRLPAAKTA